MTQPGSWYFCRAMALALPLLAAGCAGLDRDDQGALQPQTVRGPCTVKKFFLLSRTAVHTDMVVSGAGQDCTITLINPDLQVFPTASLVTVPPLHGRATAGLTNTGRSAIISYAPEPGYRGADRFTVTIEPEDHAVAFAVTASP